jgi:hypothetical protein
MAILDSRCARRRFGGRSGRRNGAPVEQRNGSPCRDCCPAWRPLLPWCAAGNDAVDEDEQLPGAGDERTLVLLSGGDQPVVEGDELWIPAKRRCKSGAIERPAQPLTSAVNVSLADVLSTLVVIGRKPGQCGGLLPGDLPDLGHAHQDRDRGWQPGAVDAVDQIKPVGEVAMLADRGGQRLSSAFLRFVSRAISSCQICCSRGTRQLSMRFFNRAMSSPI